MKKAVHKPSGFVRQSGFTLLELIIVIGFFAFLSAIIMQNLFAVYHFKEVIRYKKDINFEAGSVLNNGIAGLIRSGFAINYAETRTQNSHQPTEGIQLQTDQISIFTDRAETEYFTIYRAPYKGPNGPSGDVAQIMIQFKNGESFPLHSSETVVEDFDVIVPTDPRGAGNPDLQPYVTLYLRVRHRYPFGELVAEETQMAYKNVRASYRTTFTLRNTLPSSYKTPFET